MDKAHWTQLRGNPFMTKPTPLMLYKGEERIIRNARLKGQEELLKATRLVLFDKSYVIAFIQRVLLKPLNIQTEDNLTFLQRLIDEAFHQSNVTDLSGIMRLA